MLAVLILLPLLVEPSWLDIFRARSISLPFWRQQKSYSPVTRRKNKRKIKKEKKVNESKEQKVSQSKEKQAERNEVNCQQGFELIEGICVDIDECATCTHNCQALCQNCGLVSCATAVLLITNKKGKGFNLNLEIFT